MDQWSKFKLCVVACEADDGGQILGFCLLEADEEICGTGFAKGLKKTHRSERRLRFLDGLDLWLLMVAR
nr:hypothetical protein CFP56_79702 [Quercus suber]